MEEKTDENKEEAAINSTARNRETKTQSFTYRDLRFGREEDGRMILHKKGRATWSPKRHTNILLLLHLIIVPCVFNSGWIFHYGAPDTMSYEPEDFLTYVRPKKISLSC